MLQEKADTLVRVSGLGAEARAALARALEQVHEAAVTLLYADHSTQLREHPAHGKVAVTAVLLSAKPLCACDVC